MPDVDRDASAVDAEWLLSFSVECGYLAIKALPDDRYAAVSPMLFTSAVVTGLIGDESGYSDRWCYANTPTAVLALNAWDGTGEPLGWHRHPRSGRRVAQTGREVADDGHIPVIGEMYVSR